MHDIYKQKCLVKSIYLVLQIKHCKKVRSSIGFKETRPQGYVGPLVMQGYNLCWQIAINIPLKLK